MCPCVKYFFRSFVLICLLHFGLSLHAQITLPLVKFTDGWRFTDLGQDLSGTNWTALEYDDAAWQPTPPATTAPGLFGFEDTPTIYPLPFQTPLARFIPGETNQVITYYFRTKFQFSGDPTKATLVASNILDDGAVVYLNGAELYRVRVPTNTTAGTLAGMQFYEGSMEVVTNMPLHSLRAEENVLAVELHQGSPSSSDAVFGMSLIAVFFDSIEIVQSAQNQTVVAGSPFTLSVTAIGFDLQYQWFKNGIAISGATLPTLSFSNAKTNDAGLYHVVVSNRVNTVRSPDVQVTIISDVYLPEILKAEAFAETNKLFVYLTETVFATSSNHPLHYLSAGNPSNWNIQKVTDIDSSNLTILPPISTMTSNGMRVFILKVAEKFEPEAEYFVTAFNLTDVRTNRAPFRQVGVRVGIPTNVVQLAQEWSWTEQNVTLQNWKSPEYVGDESPGQWLRARGPLYLTETSRTNCFGTYGPGTESGIGTPLSPISGLFTTHYFRTRFDLPENSLPDQARLRFRYAAADAFVIYVNGVEMKRSNLPAGDPSYVTRALTTSSAACNSAEIILSNGVLRTQNVLAAEVHRIMGNSTEMLFGLELDTEYLQPSPSLNKIHYTKDTNAPKSLVLSWPAQGYALETKPDLRTAEWTVVATNSPYTNTFPGFFRLRSP